MENHNLYQKKCNEKLNKNNNQDKTMNLVYKAGGLNRDFERHRDGALLRDCLQKKLFECVYKALKPEDQEVLKELWQRSDSFEHPKNNRVFNTLYNILSRLNNDENEWSFIKTEQKRASYKPNERSDKGCQHMGRTIASTVISPIIDQNAYYFGSFREFQHESGNPRVIIRKKGQLCGNGDMKWCHHHDHKRQSKIQRTTHPQLFLFKNKQCIQVFDIE